MDSLTKNRVFTLPLHSDEQSHAPEVVPGLGRAPQTADELSSGAPAVPVLLDEAAVALGADLVNSHRVEDDDSARDRVCILDESGLAWCHALAAP